MNGKSTAAITSLLRKT